MVGQTLGSEVLGFRTHSLRLLGLEVQGFGFRVLNLGGGGGGGQELIIDLKRHARLAVAWNRHGSPVPKLEEEEEDTQQSTSRFPTSCALAF